MALEYNADTSDTTDLTVAASGTGPSNGSLTVTPSNNVVGVYGVIVVMDRAGSNFAQGDYDSQRRGAVHPSGRPGRDQRRHRRRHRRRHDKH